MLETELKLHVPAASRVALERALRQRGATQTALHACYFDTEQRELAKAGIALRVRLEGSAWVQTIKAPGPDELSRIELNHPRPGPQLDLSVYENTPLGPVFETLEHPLSLRYETEVTRLVLSQDAGDAVLELAFDRGVVKDGNSVEMPLCELEIELVSGTSAAVFRLGREYLEQYRLIVDLRSKAERGDALAQLSADDTGHGHAARKRAGGAGRYAALLKPRRAGAIAMEPEMSLLQAYELCASDCLNQIIRNATFLSGVDGRRAKPELCVQYVHQLRVGIRRLRSCWKFFEKWIDIGEADMVQLRSHFSELGRARDNDVVRLRIMPRLEQAGMPPLDSVMTDAATDVQCREMRQLAAGPQFQLWLLSLLEQQVCTEPAFEAKEHPSLPHATSKRLNKWLKTLYREGEDFEHLAPDAQHSLRKKVKRLRYCLDFFSAILPTKSAAKARAALNVAQDELGELNDLHSARLFFEPLVPSQPQAFFALGWLEAVRGHQVTEAGAALHALRKAGRLKQR